ncbi:hypothetical protein [Sinimarinibacterium flocculans]|uniref:Ferric reductase like protein n=1 Tax=Sinimarinibacterium flocculans TaxID=985250 RepID=A0A318EK50_9GAMM|nr:hypothetical protein [Sinimarinibacterium flocculans]PXV69630.1 hypothetical protein C8D93_103204 [Sinimarinibacterium flocculans]
MAGVSAWFARLRGGERSGPARHESFLVYRNAFYLKVAVALCALSFVLYAWHDPIEGSSGSTWLGYGLGTLGAALIVWLAWFGVRKRQFREGRAPVQAWVSAHVYLGLSLIVVATLHTGFQLGLNVHTLAWVLMMLVIVSGIYGILAYSVLPRQVTANRNEMEFRAMLQEIHQLNESALSLADRIDPETHAVVARSVGKVRIGGSAWEQLSGRYRSPGEAGGLDQFFKVKRTQLQAQAAAGAMPQRGGRQATIAFVADQIFAAGAARGGDKASENLQKLLQTIAKRKALLDKVNRDITLRSRLAVWLYVHVPLTVALLAALLVHIVTVFLYW